MPKNKTPKNGFYWYMQDILPGLRREGRVFPNGMKDVVVVAIPLWKNLPVEDRERFERIAKEKKRQANKNPEADKTRLDNQGNIIAFRENDELEDSKRRLRDRRIAQSRWPDGDELLTYPFYFVAFEYLCETEEKEYLPCEVAVLEYTLQNGIMRTYHKFIKPGSIPLGYRYSCQSHSDDTHQIPIEGFEQADDNYLGIWNQIENFINQDQRKPEYPPLYCFCAGDGVNYRVTDYCMRWLHANACTGRPNTLHKVFVLEDMVEDLYKSSNESISVTSIQDMLATSAFDYEPNTRCSYHEEKEVKYCALGSIKRFAYAISDALSPIFDFELTGNHLPVQDGSTPAYAILPPSAVHLDSVPKKSAQPKSYSSLVDNFGSHSSKFRTHPEIEGTFASRDVRYVPDSGGEASDTESTRSGSVSSKSVWGPTPYNNILPAATSAGPWARTAAMQQRQAPSVTSEEEFPSLGGSSVPDRPKYAGRATAPDPSTIPKPDPWQPPQHQPEPPQRLPNTVPMSALSATAPPIVMATSAAEKAQAAAASKRTLSQAVTDAEKRPTPPPQQPMAPSAGRGIRPMGAASRAINSGGFNPGAARSVNSSGFNPAAGPSSTQPARKPTLGEAVQQNMQSQQPAWGSSVGAVAPSSMNGVGLPGDQPLAGLGRGRGRGVYSGGARQASGGSGMSIPPGFGRGEAARAKLNSQMSGLSLN